MGYKNRLVKVVQNEIIKVDEDGNITETIPEEIVVEFTYDVLGRRIQKQTEDKTINYIYAGQNAIQENIYSFSGTELILQETRENIYSNQLDDILSTTITDHTKETPESNTYYYEKNHLGSVIKITDLNGAVVEQYEYDVFGVAYASVNNVEAVTNAQSKKTLSIKKSKGSETDSSENSEELTIDNIRYKRYNGKGKIGNTRLYTGREYDAELKLYYNRARYYSPDLGRFISRDPIDVSDDINLYAYVGNNGVMFVDRNGLAKDAIISLFRQSGEEIKNYLILFDTPLINNNYEADLNIIYFNIEFARWDHNSGNTGKYDLAYFGDGVHGEFDSLKDNFEDTEQFKTSIKGIYDCNGKGELCDGNVTFAGNELSLGEISNVLTALNAYRFGFSHDHLEYFAMKTVEYGMGNGVEGELADRELYNYGYLLGELESNNNGQLTDSKIIEYVINATTARKNYFNNK